MTIATFPPGSTFNARNLQVNVSPTSDDTIYVATVPIPGSHTLHRGDSISGTGWSVRLHKSEGSVDWAAGAECVYVGRVRLDPRPHPENAGPLIHEMIERAMHKYDPYVVGINAAKYHAEEALRHLEIVLSERLKDPALGRLLGAARTDQETVVLRLQKVYAAHIHRPGPDRVALTAADDLLPPAPDPNTGRIGDDA